MKEGLENRCVQHPPPTPATERTSMLLAFYLKKVQHCPVLLADFTLLGK